MPPPSDGFWPGTWMLVLLATVQSSSTSVVCPFPDPKMPIATIAPPANLDWFDTNVLLRKVGEASLTCTAPPLPVARAVPETLPTNWVLTNVGREPATMTTPPPNCVPVFPWKTVVSKTACELVSAPPPPLGATLPRKTQLKKVGDELSSVKPPPCPGTPLP